MRRDAKPYLKIHMRGEDQSPLCRLLPGQYQPLMFAESQDKVNCKRCLVSIGRKKTTKRPPIVYKQETLDKYEKGKALIERNPDIPIKHLLKRIGITTSTYNEIKKRNKNKDGITVKVEAE